MPAAEYALRTRRFVGPMVTAPRVGTAWRRRPHRGLLVRRRDRRARRFTHAHGCRGRCPPPHKPLTHVSDGGLRTLTGGLPSALASMLWQKAPIVGVSRRKLGVTRRYLCGRSDACANRDDSRTDGSRRRSGEITIIKAMLYVGTPLAGVRFPPKKWTLLTCFRDGFQRVPVVYGERIPIAECLRS